MNAKTLTAAAAPTVYGTLSWKKSTRARKWHFAMGGTVDASMLRNWHADGVALYRVTGETTDGLHVVMEFATNEAGRVDTVTVTEVAAPAAPKMVKVRNLMSGKEIEIAEGTPACCDPSSETYWSM